MDVVALRRAAPAHDLRQSHNYFCPATMSSAETAEPAPPPSVPLHSPSQELSFADTPSTPKRESKTLGYTLLAAGGVALFGFYAVAAPFITPAFRKHCLPFVPASPSQIDLVLKFCKPQGTLVDLGSGDGRVVIEAAKRLQIPCVGIELNRWLVWYSKLSAMRHGVSHLTRFEAKDLWKTDLSVFDQIVIFGVKEMFVDLEKKMEREIKPTAAVVAGRFSLPTWTPVLAQVDPKGEMGIHSVWVYRKPTASGASDEATPSAAPDGIQLAQTAREDSQQHR